MSTGQFAFIATLLLITVLILGILYGELSGTTDKAVEAFAECIFLL